MHAIVTLIVYKTAYDDDIIMINGSPYLKIEHGSVHVISRGYRIKLFYGLLTLAQAVVQVGWSKTAATMDFVDLLRCAWLVLLTGAACAAVIIRRIFMGQKHPLDWPIDLEVCQGTNTPLHSCCLWQPTAAR